MSRNDALRGSERDDGPRFTEESRVAKGQSIVRVLTD